MVVREEKFFYVGERLKPAYDAIKPSTLNNMLEEEGWHVKCMASIHVLNEDAIPVMAIGIVLTKSVVVPMDPIEYEALRPDELSEGTSDTLVPKESSQAEVVKAKGTLPKS